MAVISDSKTATEMRAEVLHELQGRWNLATRDANIEPRPGVTQKDIAFRRGYAASLYVQIDFWTHVWIEGKQAEGAEASLAAPEGGVPMRVWMVSFAAKRKRMIYERQDVTVTFTEEQYEESFGPIDPAGLDQMEIEQLAVEKGEKLLDDGAWEPYSADTETLDETDFEVKETTEA